MHLHFCQSYLAAPICTTAFALPVPTPSSGGRMTATFSQFQQHHCLAQLVKTSQRRKPTATRKGSKEVNEALRFLSSLQRYCQSQKQVNVWQLHLSLQVLHFAGMCYTHTWIEAPKPSFSKKETKIQWAPIPQLHKKAQGQDQIKFHFKKWWKRGKQ